MLHKIIKTHLEMRCLQFYFFSSHFFIFKAKDEIFPMDFIDSSVCSESTFVSISV